MAIDQPFQWGMGGKKLTQDQIDAKKDIARALMKQGMDYSPVGHWAQGLSRVAQGVMGAIDDRQAGVAQDELGVYNSTLSGDAIAAALGGNPSSAASAMPTSGVSGEVAATAPGGMQSYRDAIAGIESAGSGDYAAIGPTNDKLGRALGRYQIMEANIGPWSQAALGQAITPDQFMASPELQDKIFDHQFQQYVDKYGPEGAAQAWLGGEGGVGKVGRKDALGTSIGEYGNRFMGALGGAGQEVAQASPGSLTDEVSAFQQTPEYAAQFPGMEQQTQEQPIGQMNTVAQALTSGQTQNTTGINPAILRALADPRATPQTRAVAQALMQQQLGQQEQQAARDNWMFQQQYQQQQQNADPLRALQLEKGQLELDAMRNPQPGYKTLSNEEKQSLGLPTTGAFQINGEGKISQIGGGGVTVNNEGSIPAGYQANRDEQGRIVSISPIAGSPAALEAEQAQRSLATQGDRRETSTDTITSAAANARKILSSSEGLPSTGTAGRLASTFSETNAAELRRQIDVLKANATIENLSAMRQASPTGGALGSVTEKEGAMLASAAGAIDPDAGKEQVEKALDNYERTLLRVIHGPKVGDAIFENTRTGGEASKPEDISQEDWDFLSPEERRLFQ